MQRFGASFVGQKLQPYLQTLTGYWCGFAFWGLLNASQCGQMARLNNL